MNKTENLMKIKVKNEDNDRTVVYLRENGENGENDKERFVRIRKILGNNFNIEFLGVDENGCEIYRGEKDTWKNFVEYLFWLYKKYFKIAEDREI